MWCWGQQSSALAAAPAELDWLVAVARVRMEAGLSRARQLPVTATTLCERAGAQVPLLEPQQWGLVFPPAWPCSRSSPGHGGQLGQGNIYPKYWSKTRHRRVPQAEAGRRWLLPG